MLWVVSIASVLGIFFTLAITRSIARRLNLIAELVGKLAYEAPAARISTIPGGRDEINAMAKSVNAMADHKGSVHVLVGCIDAGNRGLPQEARFIR